jgi:hypothetical protein
MLIVCPGPWRDIFSGEITINSITLRETCLINYKRIRPYICRDRHIDFAIKEQNKSMGI